MNASLRRVILFLALLPSATAVSGESSAAPPSFRVEVMAVLSKAGCNLGTCHGNQNGKGGLKLSLRGQDPTADYAALVRDSGGRRIDRFEPAQSLLLQKPLAALPHQGGRRFHRESPEFAVLSAWIASGATDSSGPDLQSIQVQPREAVILSPQSELPIRVDAVFTDGSRRDVTRMAVYEPSNFAVSVDAAGLVRKQQDGESIVIVRYLSQQVPVRVAFIPPRPMTNLRGSGGTPIDELVCRDLDRLRIHPSGIAPDHVLMRRLSLDIAGILPAAEEAREFVADLNPDKYERAIDRLLASRAYAEHWALKWSDLLRNEEKVLDAFGVETFHSWLRDSFAQSKGLDELARELLTSRGSTYTVPATNYYRANRDPATRGETTARVLLGVRLQCAQCHNHPFDRWTQDDYFRWAAVFSGIGYHILENNKSDKLDSHEFVGEQLVEVKAKGELKNPSTNQPAAPRFLGSDRAVDLEQDWLHQLANWLTATDNGAFSQAQANLIWYHLLGRGLVDPVDDFRATNPAVNPPLLAYLATKLSEHRFDVRYLLREIVLADAYRRSSEPNRSNLDDEQHFSRAIVRRLPAEKILDAQSQVLDAPSRFAGFAQGIRAGQIPGVRREAKARTGDNFLRSFGKPQRLLACECERSNETTLSQALLLIAGPEMQERLVQAGNRLDQLSSSPLSVNDRVAELYWSALSRAPNALELQEAVRAIDETNNASEAMQDLAWALLNCKEFLFQH